MASQRCVRICVCVEMCVEVGKCETVCVHAFVCACAYLDRTAAPQGICLFPQPMRGCVFKKLRYGQQQGFARLAA